MGLNRHRANSSARILVAITEAEAQYGSSTYARGEDVDLYGRSECFDAIQHTAEQWIKRVIELNALSGTRSEPSRHKGITFDQLQRCS